ncbi:MAG: DUF3563 family protein [Betaproteobacteria bacterium]|nr:DUF3563 family protein [Betaproteobacteria bacterium]
MSYTGTLYEGDSLIHKMPMRSESSDADAGAENPWKLASPIVAAFQSFFDWIDRSARDARYRQIEGYLSQSTDLADLERRQRNLERNHQYF